jgi:hypothetical protein
MKNDEDIEKQILRVHHWNCAFSRRFLLLLFEHGQLELDFFLIGLPFVAFAWLTAYINWQLWVEEVEERARSGERDDEEYTGD